MATARWPSRNSIKEIYAVDEETNKAMQAMAYAESLVFFKAFGAYGTASAIRKSLP